MVALLLTAVPMFVFGEDAAPKKVSPTDAKSHIGETAVVCGKVMDAKVPKYGLSGRGKPVSFYLDQPEATSPFYFVAFGGEQAEGTKEVVDAYNGKNVCVTGKITQAPSGPPFILTTERSQVKAETAGK